MTHGPSVLSYPVRWAIIKTYLGQVCLIAAALTSIPAVVSLVSLEFKASVAFLVIALVASVMGMILSRTSAADRLQTNETLVITCITFLFLAITMSVPFMAFGMEFSDALFESVSAVTTTGLSTLADVEDKPAAFLFARAWLQWFGGMGIVVFSVALISQSGIAAKSLMLPESVENWSEGSVRLHARRILVVYSCLTLIGVFMIGLHGVGMRDALLFALAAVSTGGFAPCNDSIHGLGGWPIQLTVSIIGLGGAVPLYLYYRSFRNGWATFFRDRQTQALLVLTVLFSLILFLCLQATSDQSISESVMTGLLLGISAQTTTGFETVKVESLANVTRLGLLVPMFVGGGIGSTAGGLKIIRVLILAQLVRTAISKASLPKHAVIKPQLFGQPINGKEIEEASVLLFCYLSLVAVSWLPFVLFGYNPLDSLFEVVSACGTVGLSSGVTSQQLPTLLKYVLSADMLMGRLEVFAWLVVFSSRTWFGKQVLES